MDAKTENAVRREQMESFGRLMAGFAHDMKNHLGIIRESNGLMDDLIEMSSMGQDENVLLKERLKKSIKAIERRVVISAKMMKDLSGMAHRPGSPCSSFLVNELIEEEYTFLERFSRLAQIDVVFEFAEKLPPLYNDAALLQHVIYRVFSSCIGLIEGGQTLRITTAGEDQKAEIGFCFSPENPVLSEVFKNGSLDAAIEKLKGTLTIAQKGAEPVDVRLLIPSLTDIC